MEIPVTDTRLIPFIDARLSAGFPKPSDDYLAEPINLDRAFIKRPLSTFVFTTEGDSMIGAFIPHRSMVLVDRSISPQNGDIVVAMLNGEFTVKFYQLTGNKCRLMPANPKYKSLEITEEMQMEVWGVVIKIFIDPKDVKNVCPR